MVCEVGLVAPRCQTEVIPVVGLLYPLFRLVPALLQWVVQNRIFRVYDELKFLEAELEVSSSDATAGALSERLDRLEERADHLSVPKAYMPMLYTLKHHISLVRQRLRDKGSSHAPRSPLTHKEIS